MGYYVIFRHGGVGIQWIVYHDLVKEYRKSHENPVLDEEYWKEREEYGISVSLQWLCDAMERRGFDLIFLTDDYAIFNKRTWFQNFLGRLGVR